MKFATFNINGIGARLPRLLEWLAESTPDVVALQEIKCVEPRFPREALQEIGYEAAVSGQKGFNGVAILARQPLAEVARILPGDEETPQARWLEVETAGIHFCSLYLPNGNPLPGPKFDYKLRWMAQLESRAAALLASEKPVILAGDWNVCPTDHDLARPETMQEDALCRPESRSAFRRILAQGWTDALRARFPQEDVYTYWDYRAGAWAKNWGMRIDHLLLSPAAADQLSDAGVDREVRGKEQPSDHVPAWVELAL